MKKGIVLLSILFLMVFLPIVSAENYTEGETNLLYNITECDGPVTIKAEPNEDIQFYNCEEKNESWKCDCEDKFKVFFNSTDDKNNYNIKIKYYVEFLNYVKNDTDMPSRKEIMLENNKRIKTFDNVTVVSNSNDFVDIELRNNMKNTIMAIILSFIILVGVIYKIVKSKYLSDNEDNDDVFNEFFDRK